MKKIITIRLTERQAQRVRDEYWALADNAATGASDALEARNIHTRIDGAIDAAYYGPRRRSAKRGTLRHKEVGK